MSATPETLQFRSRVLQALRRFFIDREFVEVETPVRIPAPALESHIDAEPSGTQFLRTSPELHMKRLLCRGIPRLFQMGPCFRRGERGDHHHPEYTMLEWYRANADYHAILDDTVALMRFLARALGLGPGLVVGAHPIDLEADWHRISVREAFREHAGWDPFAEFDADRFDLDMANRVEPALPTDRPVVLIDYPAPCAALARLGRSGAAERWELYVGGIELANSFSELTDPDEQLQRFEQCRIERSEAGREVYPIDTRFVDALRSGMPPSGGIAMGIDRLVMVLGNYATINDVIPFPDA